MNVIDISKAFYRYNSQRYEMIVPNVYFDHSECGKTYEKKKP